METPWRLEEAQIGPLVAEVERRYLAAAGKPLAWKAADKRALLEAIWAVSPGPDLFDALSTIEHAAWQKPQRAASRHCSCGSAERHQPGLCQACQMWRTLIKYLAESRRVAQQAMWLLYGEAEKERLRDERIAAQKEGKDAGD
jgi:hypothetical protein